MARVLTRDESLRRRLQRKTGAEYPPIPTSLEVPVDTGDHPWQGKPVDAAERDRVADAAVAVAVGWFDNARKPRDAMVDTRRAVNRLLDWLDTFPGVSYQDRWLAAEPDSRPGNWCPELSQGMTRRWGARLAINALMLLGVLRPSYTWLFDNKQSRFWRDWTITHDPEAWNRYFAVADREHSNDRRKWWAIQHLIRICIVNGLRLDQVRGSHVVAYRTFLRETDRGSGELFAMWHYARLAGLLPGEPDDLGGLIKLTQRTPTELVDRHHVKAQRVREVLINYLTELATTQDYGSLANTSRILVGLFWKTVEDANPGIDTIKLTKTQAAAWKAWLRTKSDGTARRNASSVLGTVRAFYLDMAAWAHEDPSSWAEWAVPCPVSMSDVRGMGKERRARQHEMQARTRTLAPHLPSLAARAEQRHRDAVQLQDLVQRTPPGQPFEFRGETYVRQVVRRTATSTGYVCKAGQTSRIDTDWQVVTTFMTWAIVEVLRHTGVRVEELLELTHLSIRQYRKPDGTILPLLQIAPSKSDEERILPCSPELTAVLARLVAFIMRDGQVPICVRRDAHELTYSAPLPHLFQVREAGRSRTISFGTVRHWLLALANEMGLRDVDGTPLHFTPHDFRRLFITDLVNTGFPIHLAAKLVGHNSIDVTSAYTAVYQTDVFDAYEQFIVRRRQLRPSDEYREPTQHEWDEFVEHFGQRRIALGNCHRPYGADCVHEHACIRCDFLHVDPDQASRLVDIRANLEVQVAEAERNKWLGDVDQLRLTIAHADRRIDQLQQQPAGRTAVLIEARPEPKRS